MAKFLAAAAVTTVALAHPTVGNAQDRVLEAPGMREYVAEVLGLNASLRARRSKLGAAAERIPPAGALPDPSVTVGVMSVPVPSFDFDEEAMTQLQVGLRQTLPFPGKLDASTALARADSGVSSATLEGAESTLAAAAAEAFFDVAYVRTADAVTRERLQIAGIAVAVAESRYAAGDVQQTDVLRARIARARLEERLDELVAETVAAAARAGALRGTVGQTLATQLLVDRDGAATLVPRATGVPEIAEALARLAEANPALRTARRTAERAERAVRVSRIAGRPDVAVTLAAGVRFGGREPFLTAGLGIPVPLWSGRKQDPTARAAALEAHVARLELEDLQARTEASVRTVHAELTSIQVRLDRTLAEILPLAEAASLSALSRYRTGEADLTTVLETQDDLHGARLSLARLIADYGARRADLAALIGEEWYR